MNEFYIHSKNQQALFFDKNFNYHAGNDELKEQIIGSFSPEQIRASWQPALNAFKLIRKKYLIYKDF